MELALFTVFAAGVVTFFTPCVLPMIPIYLSTLVGGKPVGSVGRGYLMKRAALFIVGFVAVFTVMGLGAGGIGEFMRAHQGWVQLAGAVLVIVFALQFLEVINLSFMQATVRAKEPGWASKLGGLDAVGMGVLFAAGWSPCVGPVLGTVLTYTASAASSPAMGALYLGVYGLGFAVPMFLAAVFAEAGVKALRSSNKFLPVFKKVGGGFLVAVGLWLAVAGVRDLMAEPPATEAEAAKALMAAAGDKPVLVEFYKDNCSVCRAMAPVVEAVVSSCEGHAEVRFINISKPENRHLAARHNIVGVPTFAILEPGGGEVTRMVGAQSGDTLRDALQALAFGDCGHDHALPAAPKPEGTNCDEATAAETCDG
ncbi:MAG: thioredoxin fold domain-containing protein [Myxococcales bacterium]|nr:thioredoxin fold domain-containing protein [Myxococcales bacterium]